MKGSNMTKKAMKGAKSEVKGAKSASKTALPAGRQAKTSAKPAQNTPVKGHNSAVKDHNSAGAEYFRREFRPYESALFQSESNAVSMSNCGPAARWRRRHFCNVLCFVRSWLENLITLKTQSIGLSRMSPTANLPFDRITLRGWKNFPLYHSPLATIHQPLLP